ncbi:Plasmid stabilization system (fragment) [groundwater metagenome]|uniref:Plasmid stabilization system n=1 Tax=groundwater metagenome TaxID=717931 RepID=A0A098E5W9_9ZZZZ
MAEINWTEEAEDWLKKIYDYIFEDDKDTAARVVNSIYKRVEILMDFPFLGQRLMDWENRHIRVLIYGHYRIVYLIKPKFPT